MVWELLDGTPKHRGSDLSGATAAIPMGAISRKRSRNGIAKASGGKRSRNTQERNECTPRCFVASSQLRSRRFLQKEAPGEALKTTVTIRATKLPKTPMKMAATTSDEANALVGTWRVLEFADVDKDGKGVYLFGEHPRGLLRLRRKPGTCIFRS